MPTVSVLMPAARGDFLLDQAIESILGQSFDDFEFVIVDDSGSGEVAAIATRYDDRRIRVLVNGGRPGLIASLVRGCAECRGTYVARMDADDIARRDRLARQVAYLESHPEVGVLGSNVIQIDEAGRPVGRAVYPSQSLEVCWTLLLASPFAHPAVMFRRSLLVEEGLSYDSPFVHTEDFDLWTRMLAVTEGANLVEPLLYYRVHAQSVTATKRRMQLAAHDEIVMRNLTAHFPDLAITRAEVSFLRHAFVGGAHYQDVAPDIPAICRRYQEILTRFCRKNAGASGLFRIRLKAARNMWAVLRRHGSPGIEAAIRSLEVLRGPGSRS